MKTLCIKIDTTYFNSSKVFNTIIFNQIYILKLYILVYLHKLKILLNNFFILWKDTNLKTKFE